MEAWYDEHPEATFGEIEETLRQERQLMILKEEASWNERTTTVLAAIGRAFFPLDRLLRLPQDRFSEGAARVGLRLSLSACTFERAAENFTAPWALPTSGSSLWRLIQRCGKTLTNQRKAEARTAFAPAQREEYAAHRLAPKDSLAGQLPTSTDGGIVHIRQEGWKEVKLGTISAVAWMWGEDEQTEVVHLSQHSYTASLDAADDFALLAGGQ